MSDNRFAIVACCVLGLLAAGASLRTHPSQSVTLKQIAALPRLAPLPASGPGSVQQCLDGLYQIRQRVGDRLLAMLSGRGDATRGAAIFLLKLYRIRRGVPGILEQIGWVYPAGGIIKGFAPAFVGDRPAVTALISIGMPSVRAILKALPQETNALRRKLMVRVLVGVEGWAVTRFRLKRAIAKAPTPAVKANLKAALGDVTTPVPRQ